MKQKIAILLTAVILITISLSSCGAKHKYDLQDIYKIETIGFNGKGSVSTSKNYIMVGAIIDEIYGEDSKNDVAKLQMEIAFSEFIDIDTEDETQNLSNGDVVNYTITYDEEYFSENKISFTGETFSYTIEGLEEPKEIYPFEGISYTFDGVSPNASISVNTDNCSSEVKENVSVSAEKFYGLSNGDKVTLKATYSEQSLTANGLYITDDTMEITVEGADEYLKDISTFDTSELDSEMKKIAEDIVASSSYQVGESTYGCKIIADGNLSEMWKIDSVNLKPVRTEFWYPEKEYMFCFNNHYVTFWELEVTATKGKKSNYNSDGYNEGDVITAPIYIATSYSELINSNGTINKNNAITNSTTYGKTFMGDFIGYTLDEIYEYYQTENSGYKVVNKIM